MFGSYGSVHCTIMCSWQLSRSNRWSTSPIPQRIPKIVENLSWAAKNAPSDVRRNHLGTQETIDLDCFFFRKRWSLRHLLWTSCFLEAWLLRVMRCQDTVSYHFVTISTCLFRWTDKIMNFVLICTRFQNLSHFISLCCRVYIVYVARSLDLSECYEQILGNEQNKIMYKLDKNIML